MKLKFVIPIIILLSFAVFALLLWMTLSDSQKNISDQKPYVDVLNKDLYTAREVILAKNLPAFSIEKIHYITENENLFEGVEKIAVLPIGTKVLFTNAIRIKKAVSGNTYSLLIGKVWIENTTYEIEYPWGEIQFTLEDTDGENWVFQKAFWEN